MTLRKLLERERDRAAKALKIKGELQFRMGIDHALCLLMPVVEALEEIAKGRIDVQNWEIQKARDTLQELKAQLGDK